ncbi:MAG TPA: hypothetical protein VD884_11745 [Ohtaekwangia sp.]|nr:hypothetical protein [Ohtaekwangia sp.]
MPIRKVRSSRPALKKSNAIATRSRKKTTDVSSSYNKFKNFKGSQYTGMKIGRSHKWYYDKGEWKETKITPDLWEISYNVIKRRAGKAPEGSGVPEGTEYHWYIMAHQMVSKLNSNDYTTSMAGIKYKLAHKRADKEKWSTTAKTQRKRLIKVLEDTLAQLKKEPIPFNIEYQGVEYKGEAVPIPLTCHDGICDELEITLNDEFRGILKYTKGGWKMEGEPDKKLIQAIGEEIFLWFE